MKIESSNYLVQNYLPGKNTGNQDLIEPTKFFSDNDTVELSTPANYPALIPDESGIP